MAAGLGFKDFVTGEVLTAADVDGYLMQGVWVFASAAARDAAVTSPQEGNFAYLKDTNVTTYYTGSAWANLDTTGMTNPMTTTGDTIYSSSGSTPARLGIGTAGQVLQVNSGATAPEWATPAGGGGKVLQVVQGTYATETTVTSTSYTDTGLTASITPTSATSKILVMVNQSCYFYAARKDQGLFLQLLRGASAIYNASTTYENFYMQANGASEVVGIGYMAYTYLDSPATTSATTYKTQGKALYTISSGTSKYQWGSATSTLTLLEIGA
jgi:hypothetical protein